MPRPSRPETLAVNDQEAADRIGLGRGSLRKQRTTRDPNGIPFVRVGRRVLYRVADLEKFLAGRAQRPDAQRGSR